MDGFLGLSGFGALLVLFAVLSYRDVIPRDHDREGLFDNGYTAWVVGLGLILMGVSDLAITYEIAWLKNLTLMPAFAVAMYGVYCIIRRPRWMWPAWRREMERRQQAKQDAP